MRNPNTPLFVLLMILMCGCGKRDAASTTTTPTVAAPKGPVEAPFPGVDILSSMQEAKEVVGTLPMVRTNLTAHGLPISLEMPVGIGLRSYSEPVKCVFETYKADDLKKEMAFGDSGPMDNHFTIELEVGHFNLPLHAAKSGEDGLKGKTDQALIHSKGVWLNGTYGNLDLRLYVRPPLNTSTSCAIPLILHMASSVKVSDDFEPLDSVDRLKALGWSLKDGRLSADRRKICITDSTIPVILSDPSITGLVGLAGVTDAGLVHFRGNTQVQELQLARNHGLKEVTAAGLENLQGMTALKHLELDVRAKIDSLSFLTDAPLEKIAIYPEQLSEAAINEIPQRFPKLTMFYAYDPSKRLDDDFIKAMAELKGLAEFGLNYSGATDACVPHILKMNALKQVSLSNNKMTKAGWDQVKAEKPELKVFPLPSLFRYSRW